MSETTVSPEMLNRRNVHPFPARMAANIPWEILSPRRGQLRVLDPMAGSGTSLIVGRASGHLTCGVDSDPLAVLISKVATADAKVGRIEQRGQEVLSLAKRMEVAGSDPYPCGADDETREFVRYWFDLEARKQLAALVHAIQDVNDSTSRKFLWCALSRMIVAKDAGVSLARDVSHSRPHKSFKRAPIKPFNAFETALKRVLAACLFHGAEAGPKAQVWRGDARKLPLESESIDLVITSPPYLNAIDYMRGHKLSLVWMGHRIETLREIRSGSVGAECGDSNVSEQEISGIANEMGRIQELPGRFHGMIRRYVKDMSAVMREIARVLVPRGQAVMVVGDCTLRGIYIRNSAAIRLLASSHGLDLISERRRRIPDKRRYLPPPREKSGEALAKRMRTEAILSFRK
ncbi:MAG TPA: class I SAM-dependent methyltransferase [Terriglobales bacterium]|nr:class I SAM-dependent methyltransferase [Terriglobales bacterium]